MRAEDSAFALNAESDNDFFPTIFAVNNGFGPVLWLDGANDAEPDGGGVLVVGSEFGPNIAIDGNEIMARNNGQSSTLFLNADGGDIKMGSQQTHPAHAYGRVSSNGSIIKASSNVTNVTKLIAGQYDITIAGGVSGNDIVIVTVNGFEWGFPIAYHLNSTTVRVWIWDPGDSVQEDRPFSFVIYRQ